MTTSVKPQKPWSHSPPPIIDSIIMVHVCLLFKTQTVTAFIATCQRDDLLFGSKRRTGTQVTE